MTAYITTIYIIRTNVPPTIAKRDGDEFGLYLPFTLITTHWGGGHSRIKHSQGQPEAKLGSPQRQEAH